MNNNQRNKLKELGNEAFREKKYELAIEYYTQGINESHDDDDDDDDDGHDDDNRGGNNNNNNDDHDGNDNHNDDDGHDNNNNNGDNKNHDNKCGSVGNSGVEILYSNRSACYYHMKSYELAINDAEMSIKLSPLWSRGYLRKGTVLKVLNRRDEELNLYDEALKIVGMSENDQKCIRQAYQQVANVLGQRAFAENEKNSRGGGVARGVWASGSQVLRVGGTNNKNAKKKKNHEKFKSKIYSHDSVDQECWYHYMPSDGSTRPPRVASPQNTTIVIACVMIHNGKVLTVNEHGKWCSPSQAMCASDTIFSCIDRIHSNVGGDGVTYDNVGVVSVEHYPSLRNDWFRLYVSIVLTNVDGVGDKDVEGNALRWMDTEVFAGDTDHHEQDISLELVNRVRALPTPCVSLPCVAATGFTVNTVEVLVMYDKEILLLDSLQLPRTHIDCGEDIGFSASRLLRALFGFVIVVDGVMCVEQRSMVVDGVHGMRFCVAATVKSKLADPNFSGAPPAHRWLDDCPEGVPPRLVKLIETRKAMQAQVVVPLIHINHIHEK